MLWTWEKAPDFNGGSDKLGIFPAINASSSAARCCQLGPAR
jgi:hypothetical protein